jgi:hypothetical protein
MKNYVLFFHELFALLAVVHWKKENVKKRERCRGERKRFCTVLSLSSK